MEHIPVLLQETLDFLKIKSSGIYLDCTLGGGGHSQAIAEKLDSSGTLISMDYDQAAVAQAQDKLAKFPCKKILVNDNFSNADKALSTLKGVDGLLADLGYSSTQLENPDYGLSWKADAAALDMRLSQNSKLNSAADILNHYSEKQLIELFQNYGELRATKLFVKNLIEIRRKRPFQVINDLKLAVQKTFQTIPSVRFEQIYNQVFQALRIEVNQELENLNTLLLKIPTTLNSGGIAILISFHSLEDRLVKQAFRAYPKSEFKILTPKPIEASAQEQSTNKRSKSAKLRAVQKL